MSSLGLPTWGGSGEVKKYRRGREGTKQVQRHAGHQEEKGPGERQMAAVSGARYSQRPTPEMQPKGSALHLPTPSNRPKRLRGHCYN